VIKQMLKTEAQLPFNVSVSVAYNAMLVSIVYVQTANYVSNRILKRLH